MDLGEMLSKAWKIVWKNKILWIFGLLSSCGRGSGGGNSGSRGNFNLSGNDSFNFENGNGPFSNGDSPQLDELGRNMERLFDGGDQIIWLWVIGILCLVVFLSIVFLFIQSIGRAGMIRGTLLADGSDEKLSFGQVWSAGSPYFVKVFLFNLLIGIALFIVSMVLLIPLFLFGVLTMGIGLLCLLPLLCLILPIGWAINAVVEQANVALVVEDLGILDAIKRGWNVCRDNLGPVAVTALVIFIGGGIVAIIIALPLILVMVPLVIGAVSQDETVMTTGFTTFGVLLCCLLPVIMFLQGILQSYIDSAWTLTFLRLTRPKVEEPELLSFPLTE